MTYSPERRLRSMYVYIQDDATLCKQVTVYHKLKLFLPSSWLTSIWCSTLSCAPFPLHGCKIPLHCACSGPSPCVKTSNRNSSSLVQFQFFLTEETPQWDVWLVIGAVSSRQQLLQTHSRIKHCLLSTYHGMCCNASGQWKAHCNSKSCLLCQWLVTNLVRPHIILQEHYWA